MGRRAPIIHSRAHKKELIVPAPWYAVQLHEIGYYNLVCSGIGHHRIPFEGSPFILRRVARGQLGTIRTCRTAIAHKLAKIVAQPWFAKEFSRLRKSFNVNDDRRPTVDADGAMRPW